MARYIRAIIGTNSPSADSVTVIRQLLVYVFVCCVYVLATATIGGWHLFALDYAVTMQGQSLSRAV